MPSEELSDSDLTLLLDIDKSLKLGAQKPWQASASRLRAEIYAYLCSGSAQKTADKPQTAARPQDKKPRESIVGDTLTATQCREQLKTLRAILINGADLNAVRAHKKLVLQVTVGNPYWKKQLVDSVLESFRYQDSVTSLKSCLRKNGLLNVRTAAYCQKILQETDGEHVDEFRASVKCILKAVAKELASEETKLNGQSAGLKLLQNVSTLYGYSFKELKGQMPFLHSAEEKRVPDLDEFPELNARPVYRLDSARHWEVFIDESGTRFSLDEPEVSDGKDGRVVAVCVSSDTDIAAADSMHAVNVLGEQILDRFSKLAASNAGLFGVDLKSLGVHGQHGWEQMVREVMFWVLRLLPVHPSGITDVWFHIEQRQDFKPNFLNFMSEQMLSAAFARENPEKASHLHVTISVESKDTPELSWADLLSYSWYACRTAEMLRKSGFAGVHLIDCPQPVLSACETICSGEIPDGKAWTVLMCYSALPDSLPEYSLKLLQDRCRENPGFWQAYARAMQTYLLSKTYSHDVLEKMSVWLRPMGSSDPVAEFFFQAAELARLNHSGVFDGDELSGVRTALERLCPQMQNLDLLAPLQVLLRLAVSDSNAFDFAGAEQRLAAYNPVAGGHLTGAALWDGKILSSLGQYRAFQEDYSGAAGLFRQALGEFQKLVSVSEIGVRKQISQTQSYLAEALMDSSGNDPDEIRQIVEQVLEMSIIEAAGSFSESPLAAGSAYQHYLLVRYLALCGTDDEKQAYSRNSELWTKPGLGFSTDHPWPQIQYFRWLIADAEDTDLKKQLIESVPQARGKAGRPLMDLIALAIEVSAGKCSPETAPQAAADARAELDRIQDRLPLAAKAIRQVKEHLAGDSMLANRVLPFNFC